MTGAFAALAFAAVETELAAHAERCGRADRRRRHGGWAVILFGVGLGLGAVNGAAFLIGLALR